MREYPLEEDLDQLLPRDRKVLMAEVILRFARLDTVLSGWLIHAFAMEFSRGAILVQNMDMSNKIHRLKRLYTHLGETELVKQLGVLKDELETHQDVRHTIAHASCIGVSKSRPDLTVFSPARAHIGKLGATQIVMISTAKFRQATIWANSAAEEVVKVIDKLEELAPKLGA